MMSNGSTSIKHTIALIGRVFFSLFFILYALYFSIEYSTVEQSLVNYPRADSLLLAITILQFLGGGLVLIGWYTRFGAFVLLVTVGLMIWLEFIVTSFYSATMPGNIATYFRYLIYLGYAGAALYIMAYGAGAASIDYLRNRRKLKSE